MPRLARFVPFDSSCDVLCSWCCFSVHVTSRVHQFQWRFISLCVMWWFSYLKQLFNRHVHSISNLKTRFNSVVYIFVRMWQLVVPFCLNNRAVWRREWLVSNSPALLKPFFIHFFFHLFFFLLWLYLLFFILTFIRLIKPSKTIL